MSRRLSSSRTRSMWPVSISSSSQITPPCPTSPRSCSRRSTSMTSSSSSRTTTAATTRPPRSTPRSSIRRSPATSRSTPPPSRPCCSCPTRRAHARSLTTSSTPTPPPHAPCVPPVPPSTSHRCPQANLPPTQAVSVSSPWIARSPPPTSRPTRLSPSPSLSAARVT